MKNYLIENVRVNLSAATLYLVLPRLSAEPLPPHQSSPASPTTLLLTVTALQSR